MPFQHSIEHCLADSIGQGGLTTEQLKPYLDKANTCLSRIRQEYADASLPHWQLPEATEDLAAMLARAAKYQYRFDHVIVLGTGGSSLGGRVLKALVADAFAPGPDCPRVHFPDNLDPALMDRIMSVLNPKRTGVVAISKSGGTAETLSQFFTLVKWLKDAVGEDRLPRHLLAIVQPGSSPLRDIATKWSLPIMDHDPNLGGRFSVLSLVGLLPAATAGVDIERVREGANAVLQQALKADSIDQVPSALGAAVNIGLAQEKGISQTVLMPYVDNLQLLCFWYRQLWAESLGKGGKGTTPVDALGPVDQHSQLQLYLDGPSDKLFTFIQGPIAGSGPRIEPALADDDRLKYLSGRTIGDVVDAEQRAVAQALINRGKPVRIFKLAKVDEYSVGGLLMHFMLETVMAAEMIGVDPFDQPAVEEGKILTRQYLDDMQS